MRKGQKLILEAFHAILGDNIRPSASFNQKDGLLACVAVNMFICLELRDQVEMGDSHTG